MAMYPTVDETACKLKAASFSLSVKVMHDGRYLAEAIDMNGVRGPTGEGPTPDRAAFMALVLLEHYPDAYAAWRRVTVPTRPNEPGQCSVAGGS